MKRNAVTLRRHTAAHRGVSLLEVVILCGVLLVAGLVGFKLFGSRVGSVAGHQATCVAELDTANCETGKTATGGGGGDPLAAGGTAAASSGGGDDKPAPSTGAAPPEAVSSSESNGPSADGDYWGHWGPGSSSDGPGANDGAGCTGLQCAPGSGNCFVAGTPVETPDGLRAIEELKAGDLVLSRDEKTGAVSAEPLLHTYVRLAPSLVDVRITDADGLEDVVRSTPEHRFWTLDRGWTEAGSLAPGEALLDADGRELAVVSVTPVPQEAIVYNFEVDVTHTYFVGTLRALVHNAHYVYDPGTHQYYYVTSSGTYPAGGAGYHGGGSGYYAGGSGYAGPSSYHAPPPPPPQPKPKVYEINGGKAVPGWKPGSSKQFALQLYEPDYKSSSDAVYRGDSRPPHLLFGQGFTAKRPDDAVDLLTYAAENKASQYVSTSKSKSVAKNFAVKYGAAQVNWKKVKVGFFKTKQVAVYGQGFVYTIAPQFMTGVDVNQTLGAHSPYWNEYEVAYLKKIPGKYIVGARQVDPTGKWIGPFIQNPKFKLGSH